MSVPLLIGSFTSETDFKKQVANYERLLALRAKLNRENEQYSFQIEENMAGIPNAPIPFQSLSAQTSSDFALTQQATTDLLPYMGSSAASFVFTYLTSTPEKQSFVLNFPQFETRYLVGRTNLSPAEVDVAWEQFKTILITQQQQKQTPEDRLDASLAGEPGEENIPTIQGELRPIRPPKPSKPKAELTDIAEIFNSTQTWSAFSSRFSSQYSGGASTAIRDLYKDQVQEQVPRSLKNGKQVYEAIKTEVSRTRGGRRR